MSRQKRRAKVRARTPTGGNVPQIKNSGYSEGGASRTSSILKSYLLMRLSAKSDIDANLPLLRNRSADQATNTPIGAAAIQTSAIHTIGAGLKVFPRIRYMDLGISHEEARAWQKKARSEFDLWAASKHCDLYRRNNFYDLQDMAYVSYLVDGDAFALFRRKPPTGYMPYTLRLQILEGNRISNPMDGSFPGALGPFAVEMISPQTGNRIVSGVEIDADGAVEAYWVCNKVQGDAVEIGKLEKWVRVKAFGDLSGMPNIVQICHDIRSEQYRGVPYLAPVIETLKQVSRYTNAELTAAIIKSFFALFFTNNPSGASDMPAPSVYSTEGGEYDPHAPVVDVSEYGLGPGTLNALPAGVDVKAVDAGRSMSTFDAFVTQLIKQIGAAIGVPYEVIMKNFTSSYSASRAAMLQAWEEFKLRRTWFARDYTQLKNYTGKVTMYIDGMCASAATIIACAGDSVIMPANTIYMIHNPKSAMAGYFDAPELDKISASLGAVKQTIVNVYMARVQGVLSEVQLKHKMDSEEWMTAETAKSYGFVDEIVEAVPIENRIEGDVLFVNSVSCRMDRFQNAAKLREIIHGEPTHRRRSDVSMTDNEILQKLKNLLGLGANPQPDMSPIPPVVPAVQNHAKEREAILAEERQRMAALDAMKSGNPVVDTIIETAKKNGATAEIVRLYVDAIGQGQPTAQTAGEEKMLAAIKAILQDNAESGAGDVLPVPQGGARNEAAEKASNIEEVANIANKIMGVN